MDNTDNIVSVVGGILGAIVMAINTMGTDLLLVALSAVVGGVIGRLAKGIGDVLWQKLKNKYKW
jgi:hypothetical protein